MHCTQPRRRPLLLLLLLLATPAYADLWGADMGPLAILVAQGVEAFQQAAKTIDTLDKTYQAARRYVGYAEDAVAGFNEFTQYADSVVRNPEAALASAMPEANYLVRDIKSPASWRGTGELQRLLRVCLTGSSCTEFKEAITAKQARDSIANTFGVSDIRSTNTEALDIEAAYGISGSSAAAAKAALAKAQLEALKEKCGRGTDAKAMQACQDASNMGGLIHAQQTALLNEQVAEANRLKALELAEKSAEAKVALQGVADRAAMLKAGAAGMKPTTIKFTVDTPTVGSPK